MKPMEFNLSWRRILSRLKGTWKIWLLLSAVAMALTLIFHFLFVTEKGICSTVVNFSYVGLESGVDPTGNRFDPASMIDAKIVRQAAEAIGETVTDEDVERIQEALTVQGDIPKDKFENITANRSIYGEDELAEVTEIEDSSYFPSKYSITLQYKDAGFSAKQGTAFLEELLTAYERSFYESYGYNAPIGEALSKIDYEDYDYVDAIEMLQTRLSSLRAYLARLAEEDNARFVSRATGYSFSDLVSAVDTIQEEDVQWLNSYVSYNNITKDRDNLIDYYQYKIEDAERELEQQDSRLFTLNELIESYQKTNAIFPGISTPTGVAENENIPIYEFTQPSETYDNLINQKISVQTAFSETEEQLALLQRRIERLQAAEPTGDPALVEARLASIYSKITRIVQDLQATATEFFRTVNLKRAFQVIQEPSKATLLIPTVKNSIYDLVTVEAALFGLYILHILWGLVRRRKYAAGRQTTPQGQP